MDEVNWKKIAEKINSVIAEGEMIRRRDEAVLKEIKVILDTAFYIGENSLD